VIVNALELRYEIYKSLIGLSKPAVFVSAERVPPVPGEPVAIEVVTDDPYSVPKRTRRYRVTVEEITD
jgi:hypothetical protein